MGESPLVSIRWRLRKSDSCDHFLIDLAAPAQVVYENTASTS
jgi:hypothetical protein